MQSQIMQSSEIIHFFSLVFAVYRMTGKKKTHFIQRPIVFGEKKSRKSVLIKNNVLFFFFYTEILATLKTTIKLVDLSMQNKQLSSKTHANIYSAFFLRL